VRGFGVFDPATIASMTREELSELDKRIAASVARQEAAIARQEAAQAGIHEARRRQEEAAAKQAEAIAKQDAAAARIEAVSARISERLDQREEEGEDLKTFIRNINLRSDKIVQEYVRRTDEFLARQDKRDAELAVELRGARDEEREERRAVREALLALMDRLPPPPAQA
jgi:hypothetical protein